MYTNSQPNRLLQSKGLPRSAKHKHTPSPPTKSLGFEGFDSSRILILRGEILMSIENSPESLSQAILVGIILVGRLGVVLVIRAGLPREPHRTNLILRHTTCDILLHNTIICFYTFLCISAYCY